MCCEQHLSMASPKEKNTLHTPSQYTGNKEIQNEIGYVQVPFLGVTNSVNMIFYWGMQSAFVLISCEPPQHAGMVCFSTERQQHWVDQESSWTTNILDPFESCRKLYFKAEMASQTQYYHGQAQQLWLVQSTNRLLMAILKKEEELLCPHPVFLFQLRPNINKNRTFKN